ncbi:MAG: ATPase [Deltaproteobacteria bacterium RIFCSPLOWO2_02_FULL_44_10]|nr:MAG: ATPase [Deltaproteobacteria bacterium RIFCSPHIGHO2_02_FULL_44_16]OGQ46255.1 MAG: ATPase [Deltaproteobacteria bacterium RIFCSPLOWO2_02_FULL_44_10]
MYSRIINRPKKKSFFLFGPRGTGKSTWIRQTFSDALYLDLLDDALFTDLLARPHRLEELIPKNFKHPIIIDEVQKIPALLDEVHRLIESKRHQFVLTGSSARKLKQKGINLLAGRALTLFLYPLTVFELGQDFNLEHSLRYGFLPSVYMESDPKRYLEAYVRTYLKEEVQQEGLTRNLGAFSRFLEAASFSQGQVLSISEVARECSVERKVVENYFTILEDLLLGVRLPVFTKRAKRRMISHTKFYLFDAGVYRTIRPSGPLDRPEEIEGAALETLFFQEVRALNEYHDLGYTLYYWHTANDMEVDFVVYGERGIFAFEIKRAKRFSRNDLTGLKLFLKDYPGANAYFVYGGDRREEVDGITIIPYEKCIQNLAALLTSTPF